MPLNGIDISSHNEGLDLAKINCDFVVVKATQGNSYKNPFYSKWVAQAKARNMLLGVYHYIGGSGAETEAQNFYNCIKNEIGSAVICLDWESIQNKQWGNVDYLRSFIRALQKLIPGKKFMLYVSKAYIPSNVVSEFGLGLWVAQYANDNRVNGFQVSPWNEGAYTCDIRQYTSNGYLDGWSGRLDFNKAYMTREGWAAWCGYSNPPEPVPPVTDPFPQSLKGQWKVVASSGVNVRRKPSTSATIAGALKKGSTVYLDATRTLADGYVWGTYIGYSGKRCYVAIGTQKGTKYMEKI